MAKAYATEGWMNYVIRLDDGPERRVSFRNHNSPYIRLNGKWVRVFFDINEADEHEVDCEIGSTDKP